METAKAIVPPVTSQPKPMAMAKPADQQPPWIAKMPEPEPPVRRSIRRERPIETVHWGVIALTLFTAASVVSGAYGSNKSAPKELLPIVLVGSAR